MQYSYGCCNLHCHLFWRFRHSLSGEECGRRLTTFHLLPPPFPPPLPASTTKNHETASHAKQGKTLIGLPPTSPPRSKRGQGFFIFYSGIGKGFSESVTSSTSCTCLISLFCITVEGSGAPSSFVCGHPNPYGIHCVCVFLCERKGGRHGKRQAQPVFKT